MKCESKSEKKKNNCSRRGFLKTISGAAASVFLSLFGSCSRSSNNSSDGNDNGTPQVYGPRSGIPNPYVNNDGKPILVCVEGANFFDMLNAGLEALGGLRKLVTNNQNVLIKPNLFEKSRYPWISEVNSIIEIINAVKNVTTGTINVGDMCYEDTASVYNYLGLEAAISSAGGNLLHFSGTYNVRRSTWVSTKPDFRVYSDVYDSPVLINTCVLKRHYLSYMTCAVKCNVGTIAGSGATATRAYMHSQADFLAELAEVAGLSNPDLNIVDARSIVTGIGPYYHQNGKVVDTGKIIICGDIVAADAYCARLMAENDNNFSTSMIQETLVRAEELGLGTPDLNNVEIMEITA